MRKLVLFTVETGRCQHCHHDAGEHSVEGLCGPHGVPHLRHPDVLEPCFRGTRVYGFVDLNDQFAKVDSESVA